MANAQLPERPSLDYLKRIVRTRLLDLRRANAQARLADALAPGGRLVIEDFDCGWTPVLAERRPGQAALFTEVHRAFLALLAGAGADVAWGRRLYQAVLELGLEDVTGTVGPPALATTVPPLRQTISIV